MSRHKGNLVAAWLDDNLILKLDQVAESRNLNRSEVIREACSNFCKEVFNTRRRGSSISNPSQDYEDILAEAEGLHFVSEEDMIEFVESQDERTRIRLQKDLAKRFG